LIIQAIKQLSPTSKAKNAPAGHDFSDKAKECILTSLFAMLKQGGESMISVLRIWRRRKAIAEFDESLMLDGGSSLKHESGKGVQSYCQDLWGPLETDKSLAEMNLCWSIWV
jgi:hypothetical protein